ncbi:MAG: hypothetical protein IKJ34_08275, partial [Mailhella sp.]|nr:hypothetical protein [Mailhella sp.]
MEKAYVTMADSMEKKLAAGADADFICVDAIAKVPAELISSMPNLKLIHSEGVGFNGIDCKAAAERGIWVCNNRGINAEAVAEHAIMLILGLQRTLMEGQAAIVAGQQFERKERLMREGIMELGECAVGIIGFGAIGMALAKRLVPFGCRVYYNDCARKPEEVEREYQVAWMERAEMLA